MPEIIAPIVAAEADVVLGSRLKSGSALAQGMPWWKFIANRFLTTVENFGFGLDPSEYRTGCRVFRRDVLDSVNSAVNSDGFIFDPEIIAQVVAAGFRIDEIAVPSLHAKDIRRSRRFSSLRAQYRPFA